MSDFMLKIEDPEKLKLDVIIPGVPGLLEELTKIHHCYLISLRRNKGNLQDEVKRFGLERYFKKMLTGHSENDGSDKKIELIRPELSSKEALIVGDTEADVNAGHQLKLKTVAVLSGIREVHFLENLKPDYIIQTVNDLHEVISKSS
jgi:phosphoglycolate phosphatase-like HAD superfamily hydrolase